MKVLYFEGAGWSGADISKDTGDTLEDWMATAKETPLGRCGC